MNDRHIPLLAEEGWMRRAKRRRRRGGQIGEMFLRTDHPGASIGASPYRARVSRHPSQGSRTISPLFSFGRLPYCYGAGQQGSSGYSSAKRVLFRRFRGSFLSTRATERVEHSVISLVAAVLEKLIAGFLRNRKSDLPRSGIDLRIVNRHLVLDCIGVHACETFHQPKGVAGGNAIAVPSDTGLLVEEIRCLDHQRVAFPMPS